MESKWRRKQKWRTNGQSDPSEDHPVAPLISTAVLLTSKHGHSCCSPTAALPTSLLETPRAD
eukprot:scaffold32246_cov32-Cyclotella_meneghiniana.AAC.1